RFLSQPRNCVTGPVKPLAAGAAACYIGGLVFPASPPPAVWAGGGRKESGMPKMKTHKGVKKRFKVSARGKVLHKKMFSGHLLSLKSGDRRRRLRKTNVVVAVVARKIIR